MAIMDEISSTGADIRTFIGKFIIATNMVFNFGSLAFMLVKAFLTCREIYQAHKLKKALMKKTFKIQQTHRFSSFKNNLGESSITENPLNFTQNESKIISNENQDLSQNPLQQNNTILDSSLFTEVVAPQHSQKRSLFLRKRMKLS